MKYAGVEYQQMFLTSIYKSGAPMLGCYGPALFMWLRPPGWPVSILAGIQFAEANVPA